MNKETLNRPSGLTILCIIMTLGSIGGSIALPFLILFMEGPLIFLPLIEAFFIFTLYLAYNMWNLRKKSWILIKIWIIILFLMVTFPTFMEAISYINSIINENYEMAEYFKFTLLTMLFSVSLDGYIVIGIYGYYLYKQRNLFVK
jgi:hypothetical protein